jgi:hypothetical protein
MKWGQEHVGPGCSVWHIDRHTAFGAFDEAAEAPWIKMKTLLGMDASADQGYETWSAFTWKSGPTALEIAIARGSSSTYAHQLAPRTPSLGSRTTSANFGASSRAPFSFGETERRGQRLATACGKRSVGISNVLPPRLMGARLSGTTVAPTLRPAMRASLGPLRHTPLTTQICPPTTPVARTVTSHVQPARNRQTA